MTAYLWAYIAGACVMWPIAARFLHREWATDHFDPVDSPALAGFGGLLTAALWPLVAVGGAVAGACYLVGSLATMGSDDNETHDS